MSAKEKPIELSFWFETKKQSDDVMKQDLLRPLRVFALFVCALVAICSIAYLMLVKRSVARMPTITAENGDQRTVLLAIPVFRWVDAETDPFFRKLLGPLVNIDQKYIRNEYWKPKREVVPAGQGQIANQGEQTDPLATTGQADKD